MHTMERASIDVARGSSDGCAYKTTPGICAVGRKGGAFPSAFIVSPVQT